MPGICLKTDHSSPGHNREVLFIKNFLIWVWLLLLSLLAACSAPLQRAAPTPTRMNQPNVEGDPVIATVFNIEIDRSVNGVIGRENWY
jgi:hypothetical protein